MRISLRTFSILLLVASSLWLLALLAPPVYCWFKPPQDFQAVVSALQNRGAAPAPAVSAVQQTIASAGLLRGAVQIGYYVRAQVTLQAKQRHLTNEAQASYIAMFQNLKMPILLIVQKQQIDNGVADYQIAQGDPTGLVRGLVLPCAIFAGAVLALRWSKARGRGRIRSTSRAR
jgi:hypothetical protein